MLKLYKQYNMVIEMPDLNMASDTLATKMQEFYKEVKDAKRLDMTGTHQDMALHFAAKVTFFLDPKGELGLSTVDITTLVSQQFKEIDNAVVKDNNKNIFIKMAESLLDALGIKQKIDPLEKHSDKAADKVLGEFTEKIIQERQKGQNQGKGIV